MTRRGFALIGALWLIVAVGVVLAGGIARLRVGDLASRNRLALARGRWAAEACLEIARGRWGTDRWSTEDSVDLGRGTRCRWVVTDPAAFLSVNLAPRSVLERFLLANGFGAAAARWLADSIVARRVAEPFRSPDEVARVFALPAAVAAQLTTDGLGLVNPAVATRPVVRALPGYGDEAVAVLAARRALGRPVANLPELLGLLSDPARAALLAQPDAEGLVRFDSAVRTVESAGWVATATPSPRVLIEQVVVVQGNRLAALRRRIA